MFMAWGQLLSHDITFVAQTLGSNFLEELCCDVPMDRRHRNCLPVAVSHGDRFYSRFRRTCMEFVRSLAGLKFGCTLGPRDQINQLTSVIDASFVYGSNEVAARSLRMYKLGLLRMNSTLKNTLGFKELLPPRTDVPDQGCFRNLHANNFCFEAGDKRLNENVLLTALHTLFLREHNRLALRLSRINTLWDDEKLYQEARHILAAIVQHVAYSEYLPLVLGSQGMKEYNLTLLERGYFNGYDAEVNPGATSSFMTSAFRFGHSQITSNIDRFNTHHHKVGTDKLSLSIQQPFDLYLPGYVNQLVLGMINQPAESVDEAMSEQVTNHLFQHPRNSFGQDLAAINIMRGREHGVPGYNLWREYCGLSRVSSIQAMSDLLPNTTVHIFKKLYRHPDDVDLWSAGIAENPLPDSIVGPTFSCILGRQFRKLRKGDRFWYENPGWLSSFTLDQLYEIRKVTQARIICDNGDDIESVQRNAMELEDLIRNPRLTCKEIPEIDLTKWREHSM